jgi:hypothetical protein
MTGAHSTITLAEAMVVSREKSKLKKRHARHKRYYENNPDKMRAKNRDYYLEHQETIRARSRASYYRKKRNMVTGFMVATMSELVKVRITFTSRPAAPDIAMCLI